MLGHGALGVWALGQLPGLTPAGDAVAPGVLLELTLTLAAGAASGEGQISVVLHGGTAPYRYDAIARGVHFDLSVLLRPGRALGEIHAAARGTVLALTVASIAAGEAKGDATGYDNDFILLLAA